MSLLLIIFQFLVSSSFYNYTLPLNDGTSIKLSDFKGKKVMLVNIATTSTYINQLHELETLQQQFRDSLVIIAVPSNSFNSEPLTDENIRPTLQTFGHFSFLLTAKAAVEGDKALSVYKWVADKQKNGRASFEITSNFQKVLIDEEGQIIGFFASDVNPLNQIIRTVIAE